MQHPQYEEVSSSGDNMTFWFESVGPKGTFKIVVQFSAFFSDDIHNLAFGLDDDTGSFNDSIILNNDDRIRYWQLLLISLSSLQTDIQNTPYILLGVHLPEQDYIAVLLILPSPNCKIFLSFLGY